MDRPVTESDLNPLAERAWKTLLAKYPEWREHFGTCGSDDLEVAVPAPVGSNAGHLVIFTARGEDLWLRFSPPHMCYGVDDEGEMLDVIEQLMSEKALFVVITQGDSWAGTTLIRRGDDLELEKGQVARIVSWTGSHDRSLRSTYDEP